MLTVKKTRKYGRGVFTSEFIKKGTAIEVSPLIIVSSKRDVNKVMDTALSSYVYDFKGKLAIALGLGSLFNHSESANVEWKVLFKDEKILYWAKEDIPAGSQLFINYGYDPLEQ